MTSGPSFGKLNLLQTILISASLTLFSIPWVILQKEVGGHVSFQPVANTLCWAGARALHRKDLALAENLLRASLTTNFADHLHDAGYSYSANNLAYVMDLSGHFEEGLKWRKEALKTNQLIFGKNSQEALAVMDNSACEELWLGQNKKAIDTLVEATKIEKNSKSLGNTARGATLALLSDMYESVGQYKIADKLTAQGLDLTRDAQGWEKDYHLSLMRIQAKLYEDRGDFTAAVDLQREVANQINNKSEMDGPFANATLGLYCAENGLKSMAEPYCAAALRDVSKSRVENPFVTLDRISQTGSLCSELGYNDEAYGLLHKAHDGYEKLVGANNIASLDIKFRLAELAYRKGSYKDAENMAFETLRGMELTLGAENVKISKVLDLYGHICEKTGRGDDALYAYESAYETRREALGKDAPYTKESEEDCERLAPHISHVAKIN